MWEQLVRYWENMLKILLMRLTTMISIAARLFHFSITQISSQLSQLLLHKIKIHHLPLPRLWRWQVIRVLVRLLNQSMSKWTSTGILTLCVALPHPFPIQLLLPHLRIQFPHRNYWLLNLSFSKVFLPHVCYVQLLPLLHQHCLLCIQNQNRWCPVPPLPTLAHY